ncbi:nuclear apoptosis-inducing factor 1-like [Xyrichtys novacula]|uniref:Nuclear apoptosis-inducing factor 1-like n=1 Tax=Xyrichtys novacula TaxID=13765 RepID=A0AAV1H5B4_XYRNO|nr:nuclear apoptosis-inducing factor 1-like [Xyrichtys novacula]
MMCIVSSVTLQLEAVGEEVEEEEVRPSASGTQAAGPSFPSTPSGSRVRGGGQVLTEKVLQTQRDTIGAIREVREELPCSMLMFLMPGRWLWVGVHVWWGGEEVRLEGDGVPHC